MGQDEFSSKSMGKRWKDADFGPVQGKAISWCKLSLLNNGVALKEHQMIAENDQAEARGPLSCNCHMRRCPRSGTFLAP